MRIAKVVKYWEKSKFYDEETLSTLIPSSSGPEAIMQIGGAAESLEAPLDGGHSAQLLLDDFDYGSDEDDESRIAEQQRMLAEGQRAARVRFTLVRNCRAHRLLRSSPLHTHTHTHTDVECLCRMPP